MSEMKLMNAIGQRYKVMLNEQLKHDKWHILNCSTALRYDITGNMNIINTFIVQLLPLYPLHT